MKKKKMAVKQAPITAGQAASLFLQQCAGLHIPLSEHMKIQQIYRNLMNQINPPAAPVQTIPPVPLNLPAQKVEGPKVAGPILAQAKKEEKVAKPDAQK